MLDLNHIHIKTMSDVEIAQEKINRKIWNHFLKDYGLIDYFYMGGILVLKNMLDSKCPIDKDFVIEYLKAYKNIDEVSTEIDELIDLVIKEYKDRLIEKNKIKG